MTALARALALLLAALLAGCGPGDAPRAKFHTTDITGVDWGRDFRLADHHGRIRSVADFRGKVVLLFFGYTQCPDVCPATLATMAAAVRQLGADGERVQGLFATLDPARDTPPVLADYVPRFHPGFLGLRADAATTAATAADFKLYYGLRPAQAQGQYTVDHMGAIFAFDPRGRLRLLMRPETPPASIAHDARLLLAEGA